MTINSISGVNGVNALNGLKPPEQTNEVRSAQEPKDSISISKEALDKADFLSAKSIVDASPDAPELTDAQVTEYRAKLADPSYMNDKLLYSTADIIAAEFGF
jgi:negative regulator of flagellin synthesis FlgM